MTDRLASLVDSDFPLCSVMAFHRRRFEVDGNLSHNFCINDGHIDILGVTVAMVVDVDHQVVGVYDAVARENGLIGVLN